MKFVVLLLLVGLAACEPQFGFSRNRNRGFSGRGGGAKIDHRDGTYEYNYSWRNGQGKLTGGGAASYCRGLGSGWAPVTIDSPQKNSFIYNLIRSDRIVYIWTGGVKTRRGFVWSDGRPITFADWSHTGGLRVPQPDNREGNEDCLAVLDNIYNDGLKWHDVACSHRKPTVCERRL